MLGETTRMAVGTGSLPNERSVAVSRLRRNAGS
jgi:hypothetical protein